MTTIICDVQVHLKGHHLGHIQNLLRYLEAHPQEGQQYVFLLNPEAAQIPALSTNAPHIQLRFLTNEEFADIDLINKQIVSGRKLWKTIGRYVDKYEAKRLVLMFMDVFQIPAATNKLDIAVRGIFFGPYTRLVKSNGASVTEAFKHFIREKRKKGLTRMLARNKTIEKIFLFNDHHSANLLNETFLTDKFTYLPDPVYDYPNANDRLNIRNAHGIDDNRLIFLNFGMIDAKKNVANIIRAATRLSAEDAEKLCILVVGKVADDYQAELNAAIAEANEKRPELQVVTVGRFVTEEEMESYVSQSDWVSLAYVNFYSSSGVIGLATRHRKPIIATKFGVVGEQTEEFGLGIRVDAREMGELTAALREALHTTETFPRAAERFLQIHSSEAFIKTLLDL